VKLGNRRLADTRAEVNAVRRPLGRLQLQSCQDGSWGFDGSAGEKCAAAEAFVEYDCAWNCATSPLASFEQGHLAPSHVAAAKTDSHTIK